MCLALNFFLTPLLCSDAPFRFEPVFLLFPEAILPLAALNAINYIYAYYLFVENISCRPANYSGGGSQRKKVEKVETLPRQQALDNNWPSHIITFGFLYQTLAKSSKVLPLTWARIFQRVLHPVLAWQTKNMPEALPKL